MPILLYGIRASSKSSSIPMSFVRRQTRRLFSSRSGSNNLLLFQVWGANTDVGKSILSAGLLRASVDKSVYIKPVQTGEQLDSSLIKRISPSTRTETLVHLDLPLSPDLAAKLSTNELTTDADLHGLISSTTAKFEEKIMNDDVLHPSFGVIETAGGVLSPLPTGTLQADFYQPFRLPGLLVGDARLGGISGTIASYEALRLRGYSVPFIVLFPSHGAVFQNENSIERGVDLDYTTVLRAPELPPDHVPLERYFTRNDCEAFFDDLRIRLKNVHEKRIQNIIKMTNKAEELIWYPFTQHQKLDPLVCIDSASGNKFNVFDEKRGTFCDVTDAFGSWWTTGVGHGDVQVARAIAHAAGRYGHVGLPGAIHENAYEVSRRLLEGCGQGWASRVFFSDNGSTAVEVALKMAFRKRINDLGVETQMEIVGISGCYHGDTLGVMDCSPLNDFNKKQSPWYTPRGCFFEPPTVSVVEGEWTLRIPESMKEICKESQGLVFSSRDSVFDLERDGSVYDGFISDSIDDYLAIRGDIDLAALVLEPVMMGAGGMILVDPAFQRALIREARKRGMVVIFDEVFSGLWRLGAESGAKILGVEPDVAAYAKLLTGGTMPLAVTLATENIFRSFLSNDLCDALLHGHSYTGNPIGCAAAVESLKLYESLPLRQGNSGTVRYWDAAFVKKLSCSSGVRGVADMGTVLAVELDPEGGTGYSATASVALRKLLMDRGVMTRPLGNVLYVMVPPLVEENICRELSSVLLSTFQGRPSR